MKIKTGRENKKKNIKILLKRERERKIINFKTTQGTRFLHLSLSHWKVSEVWVCKREKERRRRLIKYYYQNKLLIPPLLFTLFTAVYRNTTYTTRWEHSQGFLPKHSQCIQRKRTRCTYYWDNKKSTLSVWMEKK